MSTKIFWGFLVVFIGFISWTSLKGSWVLPILQAGTIMIIAIAMVAMFMKFNE